MLLQEPLNDSCRAIIKSIADEKTDSIRDIKIMDLSYKIMQLKNKQPHHHEREHEEKRSFDIAIFTVVETEFHQLSKILPFDEETTAGLKGINGLKLHAANIHRSSTLPALSVLIVHLGFPGNINTAISCMMVYRHFNVGFSILCGIAAGVPEHAPKYSVIVSDTVFNYEAQRLDEDDVRYRINPVSIEKYHENILSDLSTIIPSWKNEFLTYANENLIDPAEFDPNLLSGTTIKMGVIASGGKLLADGKTLMTLREEIPLKKGVLAAEMEGSGFSSVCRELRKEWVIFRGISDHGEGDKNDLLNKKYQKVAAAGAVFAAVHFLKYLYQLPEERDIPF